MLLLFSNTLYSCMELEAWVTSGRSICRTVHRYVNEAPCSNACLELLYKRLGLQVCPYLQMCS